VWRADLFCRASDRRTCVTDKVGASRSDRAVQNGTRGYAAQAGEAARTAAEAARDAAISAVHATAETLQATLESMKTVEDMRRTLRDIRDLNKLDSQ
jgi:hypothetical protein